MQDLTRLVTESLVRHGFDRPLDYRRLQWSRWFRCDSHHSLLLVPSKPGVFALAEEIMSQVEERVANRVEEQVEDRVEERRFSTASGREHVEERPFRAASGAQTTGASAPADRRMLAVTQFFADDDMAFVLDRMFSRNHPMRTRLESGRYFVRFVVIEDQAQRQSICNALNQWIANSAEKATGIGSHFATSLELTPQTEYVANDAQQLLFDTKDAHVGTAALGCPAEQSSAAPGADPDFSVQSHTPTAPQLDSGAATNIHCPSPFPSGF